MNNDSTKTPEIPALRSYFRNLAGMLTELADASDPRVIRLGLQVLLYEVPRMVRALISGGAN